MAGREDSTGAGVVLVGVRGGPVCAAKNVPAVRSYGWKAGPASQRIPADWPPAFDQRPKHDLLGSILKRIGGENHNIIGGWL